ncbi:hypothetical protein AB0958_30975 [Streptomyces sp. NPDC006655]|uniref:hypothetical protein n=1 Tax=Streptomyces sp. NPDC006655 TaxID=3156898 RepID=UPI003451E5FA
MPGLVVLAVERRRPPAGAPPPIRTTNQTTIKTIHVVTSLAPEQATPERIAELIRGH